MIDAFSGSFSVLVVVAVGAILYRIGFLDDQTAGTISKLAMKVAVPCMLFVNAVDNFTWQFLHETGVWFFLPLAVIVVLYGIAWGIAPLLLPAGDRGVFAAMFSMPNTLSIGLPITLAIFGVDGVPFVTAYYVATAIFFWGFAVNMIARDGGQPPVQGAERVKKVFSPPFVAFLLGAAVSLSGIPIPFFAVKSLGYLGDMTTPLTLLLTGTIIGKMGRSAFILGRSAATTLAGRFAISPVICFLVCFAAGAPAALAKVYVVQAGLPSMNQVMLMSKYYHANEKLAAQMLVITSAMSVIFVPLTVLLLQLVYGA